METKDLNRLQDIKNKPAKNWSGLASKMSKLITNADKAQGRYEAAWVVFGDHPITNIFKRRVEELTSEPAHPVHTSVPVMEICRREHTIFPGEVETKEEVWTPPSCW